MVTAAVRVPAGGRFEGDADGAVGACCHANSAIIGLGKVAGVGAEIAMPVTLRAALPELVRVMSEPAGGADGLAAEGRLVGERLTAGAVPCRFRKGSRSGGCR